jgi:RNA polymerase sigma-70 factor (ECF subfamily)
LNADLAEDLTQETLVKMLEGLSALRLSSTEAFWAWLYRTALGVVQHHYRRQRSRRAQVRTMRTDSTLTTRLKANHKAGAGMLMRKELAKTVLEAVGALKLEYRNILTLRCLDNLPYAQIATVLGGTELRARLLFLRARRCLERELRRRGVSKAEMLLALATFAGITAGSGQSAATASAAVQAGSVKVGVGTKVLGTVASIRGVATIALVLVALLGSVATRPPQAPDPYRNLPDMGMPMGLWNQSVFTVPSRLVTALDPDNSGWQATDLAVASRSLVPVDPNILAEIHRERPSWAVVIPDEHTVELEFPVPIGDGPGPDIIVTGRAYGKLPDVAVIDRTGRLFPAQARWVRRDRRGDFLGYDLADTAVPPDATHLRITGTSNDGSFALIRTRARIARPEDHLVTKRQDGP